MAELSASRIATLTLLLADVEGSVRHWEADEAAAAAALRRLSEIASEASDRHEGVRPVEQGEGDSFVIAFSRPSQALACALEIQLATLKEACPGGRELRARMALHSGEVEMRDDGRYAGHAFNRSARLRALAHGGQTLVTRATHDLVVDALPEGAFFKDLGEHRLRDLARPERVYQLCHPDLPDQFTPLRSLSALPNNLPQQLTSFIGRGAEMAQVRGLLDGARLITLTGAGDAARRGWRCTSLPICSRSSPRGSGGWTWRRSPTPRSCSTRLRRRCRSVRSSGKRRRRRSCERSASNGCSSFSTTASISSTLVRPSPPRSCSVARTFRSSRRAVNRSASTGRRPCAFPPCRCRSATRSWSPKRSIRCGCSWTGRERYGRT